MKFVKIAGVTTVVLIALAILGVTLVFAQKPTPTTPPWWNTMQSMMGGSATNTGVWQSMQQMHNQMIQNGGMSAMHEWMHQSGGVHDTVWKALAEKLGMTSDELTAQIKSGKTLAQIAQEKGVSTKDLAAVMETTMESALAQAVKDGKLTQAQADLMIQHMDGQYEWMVTNMSAGMLGTGSGSGTGPGGMMGTGSGSGMMGPGGMMGSRRGGGNNTSSNNNPQP